MEERNCGRMAPCIQENISDAKIWTTFAISLYEILNGIVSVC